MSTISYKNFKPLIDTWAKQKDKGEQCLSRLELGQSSQELDDTLENLRQTVDLMMEDYLRITNQLGLEEVVSNQKEDQQSIPKELQQIKNCVDMYEQEYMVKDCIRGIVSKEGFATKQHLAGSIALWKSESYLDEDLIHEIKQL